MTWIEQLEQASQTIAKLQSKVDRGSPAGALMFDKLQEAKHVIISHIIIEREASK